MTMTHDTQQQLELDKPRRALIARSDSILHWIAASSGNGVPEKTVSIMHNHADDCAEWLMESIGFEDFDAWLDRLSVDDRGEFEVAILPFVLLIHHSFTPNVYEMIGDSLQGVAFRDKFPMGMVSEVQRLMKNSFVESGSELSGQLSGILQPKLVPDNFHSMLHPELFAQINGQVRSKVYRDILTCTYSGWVPDERGVRALTALSEQCEPGMARRNLDQLAAQIVYFAPSKCPGIRQKLVGHAEITMDECSQRMGLAMGVNAANQDNLHVPMLGEAVSMCPEYRERVMRQDMFEAIKQMLDFPKPGTSMPKTCAGIAEICLAVELSQHDINFLLHKIIGGCTTGRLYDLDKQPASVGLEPIVALAVDRDYLSIRKDGAIPELVCGMIKIVDPEILLEIAGEDDARNSFMYKLTHNDQHLHRLKDGEILDACFSSDLGL